MRVAFIVEVGSIRTPNQRCVTFLLIDFLELQPIFGIGSVKLLCRESAKCILTA